jgi:hypothetical protein
MKYNFYKTQRILAALFAFSIFVRTAAAQDDGTFPFTVRFEPGDRQFAAGDQITIQQVRGTKATLATGETYVVEGTYTLTSRDAAEIALFVTTPDPTPTRIDPKQILKITNGTGTFRLVKTMTESGYPHVSFYPVNPGGSFGGVYFGEGNWLLHDKRAKAVTDSIGSGNTSGALSGPNQVLFEYLGEPVEPPADMNPAYSKAGLLEAVRTTAAKAGVTLKKIEVDDSEFPFLIGIVCDEADFETRFKQQLKKMDAYEYTGSVSSHDHRAFNIVPWSKFPKESSERIGRRLLLRQRVLFDRISGEF